MLENQVNYDYLKPTPPREVHDAAFSSSTGSTSSGHAHFIQRHNSNSSSSGSCTQQGSGSPIIRQNHKVLGKPVSPRLSKSPSRSPHHTPIKSPQTSFPTRGEVIKANIVEDTDTYVYMAPLSDFPDEGGVVTAGHMMAGRAALDIEFDLGSDGEGR
jgi:hypothetical protein